MWTVLSGVAKLCVGVETKRMYMENQCTYVLVIPASWWWLFLFTLSPGVYVLYTAKKRKGIFTACAWEDPGYIFSQPPHYILQVLVYAIAIYRKQATYSYGMQASTRSFPANLKILKASLWKRTFHYIKSISSWRHQNNKYCSWPS